MVMPFKVADNKLFDGLEEEQKIGFKFKFISDSSLKIFPNKLKPLKIKTVPYPGFPTDMQAQWMVAMSIAKGACSITEKIFENRFMHVPELQRMGADISMEGASAIVKGVDHLSGAPVMASDLRASAALILAGIAARDETWVQRIYHLDRGYEQLENKLDKCKAEIKRI